MLIAELNYLGHFRLQCDISPKLLQLGKKVTFKQVGACRAESPRIAEGLGDTERVSQGNRKALLAPSPTVTSSPIPTRWEWEVPFDTDPKWPGPFTVEATPFPTVQSLDEAHQPPDATTAVARSGATSRQHQWRDELVKTGIRGKGGQKITFADLEPVPGTRHLHAIGSTVEGQPAAISFGPEHAPLEQRQVALALEEANKLVPKPKFVVFASFAFDSEAAKDIDETNWPGVILLKAQMNPDLLTEDLKKGRASNESFWLMGQPDVVLRPIRSGDDKGKWEVEVNGFDYFNTKTGDLESGGAGNIAMWLLDPNYDGRAVFPQQIFFPKAGEKEGWARLSKELKAQLDEEKMEAFRGTVSLPFTPGTHRRVAVKVIDDRGIESLKVLNLE